MARIERGHPGHGTLGHIRSRVQGDSRGDGFLVFYAHANGPPRFIVGAATPGALSKTFFFSRRHRNLHLFFFVLYRRFRAFRLAAKFLK